MQKKSLTPEEMTKLVKLVEWAVNGSEHGVMTYDQWRAKCLELKAFLKERGYNISGQFFL